MYQPERFKTKTDQTQGIKTRIYQPEGVWTVVCQPEKVKVEDLSASERVEVDGLSSERSPAD